MEIRFREKKIRRRPTFILWAFASPSPRLMGILQHFIDEKHLLAE
jgi:hypothetical protein